MAKVPESGERSGGRIKRRCGGGKLPISVAEFWC